MDVLRKYIDPLTKVKHTWYWENGTIHFQQEEIVDNVLQYNKELAATRKVKAFSGDKVFHPHMKVPGSVWVGLKAKGYDIFSNDPTERKRCLKKIEQDYPLLINSNSKVFS